MSQVFRNHLWNICLSYLDDIILFARTPEDLLERLRIIIDTRSRLERQAVQMRAI